MCPVRTYTPKSISNDGGVVVGYAEPRGSGTKAVPEVAVFNSRAFVWTPVGGMVNLGTLNGGTYSDAAGVSGNGSVIVGTARDGAAGGGDRAYRWTQADGMVSLGVMNGGTYSSATGVSIDGTVVVGEANDGRIPVGSFAFRWTQTDGMVNLGALNGGNFSVANAVSGDGKVVVGRAADGALVGVDRAFVDRAFRWSASTGMVSLGAFDNGIQTSSSSAVGTNFDGSIVIGNSVVAHVGPRPFIWTQAGGNGGPWRAKRRTWFFCERH